MNEFHTELRLRFVFSIAVAAFSIIATPRLGAQARSVSMLDFTTGSDYEDYLRVLQIAGKVPLYPWSIRGFSRREIEKLALADSTGPWKMRDKFSSSHFSAGPLRLGTTFNSAYPYGANDGPLWAGRGLTVAASGGVSGYVGPFSFAFDPMAFSAANRPFELLPNGATGPQAFNHGTFAGAVDLPQRFVFSLHSTQTCPSAQVLASSSLVGLPYGGRMESSGGVFDQEFLLTL